MSEPTSHEPAPAGPDGAPKPGRRTALFWLAGGTGLAAAGAVSVPLIGYVAGVLRGRSGPWVSLGSVSLFPPNETRLATFENPYRDPWDGASGRCGAYVRCLGKDAGGADSFRVLAMNCTHLGCAVTWFPQSGLFMCPCHGGVYYETGERAAGPPPRGLYTMPWRVTAGVLEVLAPHLPTLQDTLEKPSDLVQLGVIRRGGERTG